ncbi:MAG TPA: transcription-repair coupling factor [Dehalococcoidia bacterium]|nr:transcription-repair coupling factor [Dehalococcoidia bacterium]
MDLSQLLHLFDEVPEYRQLAEELERADGSTQVTVLEAAKPFLVAALYRRLQRPLVMITAQPDNARKLYDQLMIWCGCDEVRLLPEPDALPYERVISDTPSEHERLRVLSALVGLAEGTGEPPLVVASTPAFIQKAASYEDFAGSFHTIKVGMEVEPVKLLERWQSIGYRVESIVEVPGTAGRRGGILDIFPATAEIPVRLEFFGNTVESIRLFDPTSQRSLRDVPSVTVGPATELLTPLLGEQSEIGALLSDVDLSGCNNEAREQYQRDLAMLAQKQRPMNFQFYAPLFNKDSLLDYLPDSTLFVLDEPRRIELSVADFDTKSEELRAGKRERGELPVTFPKPHLTWDELREDVESRQRLAITAWGTSDDGKYRLVFTPAPSYAGQLPDFINRVKQMLARKQRIIVVSHQASRLSELFAEEDIIAPPLNEVKQPPLAGSLMLVQGLLDGGWVLKGSTALLADSEIFGFIKQQRLLKKRPVPRRKLAVDIKPGDYVVHIEHGIAEFTGFRMMKTEHGEKEFLVLRYAAGDRLYVPSDQIDRVARYVGGSGDHTPVLSRLGTQEWARTKQKVKESVEEMEEELLALYAARDVVPGFSFSPDALWQRELEASFPYVETPDQIEVQGHVKEDMEQGKPMDRLVCGDVGYGKTEVALRAAFKAVLDGKQVAVLVPTTVLAQQHYTTFKERLEAFPVVVEVLSRFRSPREQQVIIDGLASGRVDICIGTHRLIQKDVSFKDLGLLVIDEEQRFGVAHKEYLKQMRQEVDVLTLSATPIPRTLHMALTGVRDMSTMETPPEERLPIKTYVAEYDERLIREAILREMERNGQVFFVHNRVQSIPIVAEKLEQLVPEARIAIAHGQMPEYELEQVTTDFVDGKSDILLCTTIIESGLDMPNVNTLIVNRADKFGLTQLYQLRGRVGRGAKLAYAYFLFDKGQNLTPVAEKRLRTIYEATELGAGFGIAMKDLEIRGAGTLLGTRQSGHITAVGFHLYTQLLASAVEKLKAKQAGIPETELVPSHLPSPSIDLPLVAFIPEEYVPDLITRLDLYQEMVKLESPEQVDNLAADFKDRFGPLPPEVENLLYAAKAKVLAARAYIESIITERGEIVLRLVEGLRFNRQKLEPVLRDGIRLGKNQIGLSRRRLGREWREVLVDVLRRAG